MNRPVLKIFYNELSGRNFTFCRLYSIYPIAYSTAVFAAVIGQPVDPAIPQQPFGPSSAQQGFGQGNGQGLSQIPSAFPPAQHGFGQPVIQGIPEQPVDSAWAAIIFGHVAEPAVIGPPPNA
jgi:hypothetical protein